MKKKLKSGWEVKSVKSTNDEVWEEKSVKCGAIYGEIHKIGKEDLMKNSTEQNLFGVEDFFSWKI